MYRTQAHGRTYTIHELADLAGVSPWSIKRWIKVGDVPRGIGQRRWTRYTDDHLAAIVSVKRERIDHNVRLGDIGERNRATGRFRHLYEKAGR